jgi:hypothetical protein
MTKRLYLAPTEFWRLPAETDLPTLRTELLTALESGATLTLEVDVEGILAELTIVGSRLSTFVLVDTPLPTGQLL